MPYKRVLCAVDFSDDSVTALNRAVELVRHSHGQLLVLHVVEAQVRVAEMRPENGLLSDVTTQLEDGAREAMDMLMDSVADQIEGIKVTTEIDNGMAFPQIVDHAKEWRADLIVIAARGNSAVEDTPLGGTADQVVRESPCSVLLVRIPA